MISLQVIAKHNRAAGVTLAEPAEQPSLKDLAAILTKMEATLGDKLTNETSATAAPAPAPEPAKPGTPRTRWQTPEIALQRQLPRAP